MGQGQLPTNILILIQISETYITQAISKARFVKKTMEAVDTRIVILILVSIHLYMEICMEAWFVTCYWKPVSLIVDCSFIPSDVCISYQVYHCHVFQESSCDKSYMILP